MFQIFRQDKHLWYVTKLIRPENYLLRLILLHNSPKKKKKKKKEVPNCYRINDILFGKFVEILKFSVQLKSTNAPRGKAKNILEKYFDEPLEGYQREEKRRKDKNEKRVVRFLITSVKRYI